MSHICREDNWKWPQPTGRCPQSFPVVGSRSEIGELRRWTSHGFMAFVSESHTIPSERFEDIAWLFTCDSRNRGLIRQGFDEAALLWKAVKTTRGNILEIGRNFAGSTVLLAAAAPDRQIYSIDNRSHEDARCRDYLTRN